MFYFIILITALFGSMPALSQDASDLKKFLDIKSCGNPCVISYNGGGNVDLFQNQAEIAKKERIKIIIDGPCRSACVILADHARDMVCVTPRASFGFHMGYVFANKKFITRYDMREDHSPDISGWITRNGGLPKDGFLNMTFAEARSFWRVCD